MLRVATLIFSDRSLRNTSQVRFAFGHIFARCLVSEHFTVRQKNGKEIQFLSRSTDADVLVALESNSSPFAQKLRKSGQVGQWSQNMRAWAHFFALQQKDDTEAAPLEVSDGLPENNVQVQIDSRERKLISHIHEFDCTFPITVRTLRVADIIIGSHPHEIYIERKSMQDLVCSVFDTRLHNQVGNKLHSSEYERFRSLVIVEGSFSQLEDMVPLERLPYLSKCELVNRTMARLSLRDQIPVLRSDDIAGTFALIRTIAQEYPKLCGRPKQYSMRVEKPFRPRRGEDPSNVLTDQLRCVRGISHRIAYQLAGKCKNMSAFLVAMNQADDPVAWLINRCQKGSERLNLPTAVLLAEALCGSDAVSHENFVKLLATVPGISSLAARDILRRFHNEAGLCEALRTHSCAPEPVRRAMHLGGVHHSAARGLVAKFLGANALQWDDLIEKVSCVRGISRKTAQAVVDQHDGLRSRLIDALKIGMKTFENQKKCPQTGLRRVVAQDLLLVLTCDDNV